LPFFISAAGQTALRPLISCAKLARVNQPTPAIVPQAAARRLPRLALFLLCIAYVLPGFLGRDPWKSADMASFGYMAELARGATAWLNPQLMDLPSDLDALLPYWLGAWAIQAGNGWLPPDVAVRVPFALLLALLLVATWYGVYYLARSPQAQPVAFAFGGEASPTDYARAMADGGLLALIACLGLAQLSHETTPALAQASFTALMFFGLAALPYRTVGPAIAMAAGLVGLALSGSPAMGVLFGAGGVVVCLTDRQVPEDGDPTEHRARNRRWAVVVALLTMAAAAMAWELNLWRWRIELPQLRWEDARSLGRLLLWFTWPAWPLALWTLWRWRRQLASRHVLLPLWFALVSVGTTLATTSSDRSLMQGLPALATLAAFALPTFRRSAAALIDWFTLLFFSGCAFVIWVVYFAMQTGVPRQPAANVAKLAPGFEPSFSLLALLIAIGATVAWAWLVKWRVGRHRAAIWKSLVLPAGGATLSWLLLMTLWLPLLDFARSYGPLVRNVAARVGDTPCVEVYGLTRGQIAAFQHHAGMKLQTASLQAQCQWLLVDVDAQGTMDKSISLRQWKFVASERRPADKNQDILVYQRVR
jgi:4-amino-4-deoxy-L-arabinose transferase-like glycosyltransferase